VTISGDIQSAMKRVLGCEYVPDPYSQRLKDGSRIYRVTGRHGLYRAKDTTIRYEGRIVTEEDYLKSLNRSWPDAVVWEYRVVSRDPAELKQALETEMRERGHVFEVRVGTGYASSVAFKLLKANPRPEAPPPAIASLLSLLPPPGCGWPRDERERWLQTLTMTLDLMYPEATDER
jgi:hypothetical protein